MSVFGALTAICGQRHVRSGGIGDAVATVPPHWVAAPASAEQVSDVVALAADGDLAVAARGAGSQIDWGSPPSRLDVLVDLSSAGRAARHTVGRRP